VLATGRGYSEIEGFGRARYYGRIDLEVIIGVDDE
jgi:hypothetical protein